MPGSPNWYWNRMGFLVKRKGVYGLHRTVVDNRGNYVCVNAGYDTELGIARWIYYGAIFQFKYSNPL